MTRMDQIVVKFYQACCCHCCIGLIEHYIGVSLADTCSYFVPVQCTSHSCVGSRLVMSICSRGRLQGQLNSWVTSSEKTLASKLLPVLWDSRQSFWVLHLFLHSSSHFATALQAVSYGHMKQGQ